MREAGVRHLVDALTDIDAELIHRLDAEAAAGTVWATPSWATPALSTPIAEGTADDR
jgi:hypothetical protein